VNATYFELFNTSTELSETSPQGMSQSEADERNRELRQHGEPQRWVPAIYPACGICGAVNGYTCGCSSWDYENERGAL
jgi:hypothetical protein